MGPGAANYLAHGGSWRERGEVAEARNGAWGGGGATQITEEKRLSSWRGCRAGIQPRVLPGEGGEGEGEEDGVVLTPLAAVRSWALLTASTGLRRPLTPSNASPQPHSPLLFLTGTSSSTSRERHHHIA